MERACLFCMLILVLSCNGGKYTEDSLKLSPVMENDSLFFVDIDTAQELKVLNISELFSQVRYIPLETNASSLIGRITQLCVKGDTLLILDMHGKATFHHGYKC